jgi:hypothetical protein
VHQLEAKMERLDGRVEQLDSRLSSEVEKLRKEIRDEGLTTRRHIDVVAESLRDDIRLIAEGFIALDAKVERMRRSSE